MDYSHNLVELKDGSYFIIGATYKPSQGTSVIHIVKLDSLGKIIWSKEYDHKDWWGYRIAVVSKSDMGLVIMTRDAHLFKMDTAGNVLWANKYNAWDRFHPMDLKETEDRGFIIAGTACRDDGLWKTECISVLLKIDSLGNLEWHNKYSKYHQGRKVIQTLDQGYLLLQGVNSYSELLKLDQFGDTIWSRWHDVQQIGALNVIKQTPDSGFIAIGNHYNGYDRAIFTVKLNKSGKVEWANSYGSKNKELPRDIIITSKNNYVIAGLTYDSIASKLLFQIDTAGAIMWENSYSSSPVNYLNQVKELSNNRFGIIGAIKNAGSNSMDVDFLVTDSSGIIYCKKPDTVLQANSLLLSMIKGPKYADTITFRIDTFSIIVSPGNFNTINPLLVQVSSDTSVCFGDTLQLEIIGGSDWVWSPSASLDCNNCSNPLATPDSSTNYAVTYLDHNACPDSADIKLTVLTPSGTVGFDTTICDGDTVQLHAGGGQLYSWNTNNSLNCLNCSNPVAKPNSTQTFFVTVTDSNNCSFVDSVQIIVNPAPLIEATADTSVCFGDSIQLNVTGGLSYEWKFSGKSNNKISSDSIPNPMAYIKSTDIFFVVGMDSNGCENEDSVEIIMLPEPKAHFNTTVHNKMVHFQNASTNATSYEWDFGDGNKDTVANPKHKYAAGFFEVCLIAINKCGVDTFCSRVHILNTGIDDKNENDALITYYPNPVSKTLYVNYSYDKNNDDISLSIVNIFGEKLYETSLEGYKNEISLNVSELPPGMYFLFITGENLQSQIGKIVVTH